MGLPKFNLSSFSTFQIRSRSLTHFCLPFTLEQIWMDRWDFFLSFLLQLQLLMNGLCHLQCQRNIKLGGFKWRKALCFEVANVLFFSSALFMCVGRNAVRLKCTRLFVAEHFYGYILEREWVHVQFESKKIISLWHTAQP